MCAPTLSFFELDRETVACCDASSYGLSAVHQVHDGESKPVAFGSRTLTSAECKYAQFDKKECFCVVYACEKFERYPVGLPSSSC